MSGRYYEFDPETLVEIDAFAVPGRPGEWCCYFADPHSHAVAHGHGPLEVITSAARLLLASCSLPALPAVRKGRR